MIRLNRFEEAKEIFARAMAQKLESSAMHYDLYVMAFMRGDTAAMQQQFDWAKGKPNEYAAISWQVDTAEFAGQLRQAREFSRRSSDLAQRRDLKEIVAHLAADDGLREAIFGHCQEATEDTAKALDIVRSNTVLIRASRALALCGEVGEAQSLADELAKRNPQDTLINAVWLPTVRAVIEIHHGNPAQAIQLLQATSPYEGAASFWPIYFRGQAYLRQGAGTAAAAEFQKILDHRGQEPASRLYPLAHLGLARAEALTGETSKSRQAYQDFLALWKDADADLHILVEAKKEYEKLK